VIELNAPLLKYIEAYSWLLSATNHLISETSCYDEGDRKAIALLGGLYRDLEKEITPRICGALEAKHIIRKDRDIEACRIAVAVMDRIQPVDDRESA